jgi:hydroxypyruvate isomerase
MKEQPMKVGLCLEMVFTKLPFEERVRKAAEAGFKHVEMWLVDGTFHGDAAELAAITRRHKVTITNTVIGSASGSSGALTNPGDRRQWLDRARMTLDFTRRAGIGASIVCTGNSIPGMTDKQMMQSVVEGLKRTAKLAEAAGVTLLLEPLNTTRDHKGYWLDNSDKGAEICRRVGSPRTKLLFDCYHMQIMEGDLTGHIRRNLDVIGHFHSAGHPGRHELWLGEVNYAFLARQVYEMGYHGVFALEYAPSLKDEISLRKTMEYLSAREK